MKIAGRFFPICLINKIVPIGDLVIYRTAIVAEGNAAIHAARRLVAQLRLRQRRDEFAKVPDAVFDRLVVAIVALELEETCDLTHGDPRSRKNRFRYRSQS